MDHRQQSLEASAVRGSSVVPSCSSGAHQLLAFSTIYSLLFPPHSVSSEGYGDTTRVRASKLQKHHAKHGARPHAELLLRLYLESNPEALCLVRATLQRATEVVHFHESESRAIVRSVDEALANVIRHAYHGRIGKPIEVTCRKLLVGSEKNEAHGLEIVLSDSGVPVNPKKLHGRPLEEIRPGGLGLHFMKQSMDVVEFRRKNGKNLLRMVKYLAPSKPEEKI